jgi:hypothetical protein
MSERELREQLKITKRMLEMQHGVALEHGTPEEAEAYYRAIQDLDTALVKNWRTDGSVDGLAEEWIEKSREARQEGYEAATKMDGKMERIHEKYGSKKGYYRSFWDTILEKIGL